MYCMYMYKHKQINQALGFFTDLKDFPSSHGLKDWEKLVCLKIYMRDLDLRTKLFNFQYLATAKPKNSKLSIY